ncbi:2,3-bisphosphoglycerate-independent phosphoglycerate mutase [Porphyromonadaceae bacterium OttesenSCG-928-L07]|nr:2,3-bisphosphoglycerate-independent phosphoglycerate mutase [Porphyromonadaceae bacterium OttesenSCG-928-L07]MDL2251606.1 2,3-bisphosphoglycerate-independent phosphoglycerate mutase [Odoribacter sp. OttesenSCG-928-J03]MDL2330694.1 2,3-bisphosphoglycerate-independent phosphoglycerate mutase [Odoribacter sp. OttesenSCG-928-A06]
MQKTLLMILDGWGIGKNDKSNVIYSTPTPVMDGLLQKYPHSKLCAGGECVGLPDGQMGNSEVGHLNIGAGRVVLQDLVRINKACKDKSLLNNPEIVKAFTHAKSTKKNVHFMGLLSDGGVHSSLDHLKVLCDIAAEYLGTDPLVHCFMDGRDTDPKSGLGFIRELKDHMSKSSGRIATIVGRYYAMDRDNRWERIKEAYDLLVFGTGYETQQVESAIQQSYDEGVTDEFIKPIVHVKSDGTPVGLIQPGDVVIFFNYRNDRAKELTIALTQKDMPEYTMRKLALYYCTMTPYDATFQGLHVLFDKENVTNTIGEVISVAGLKQLRIAETEKYAHVTFFLNGGREEQFEGESRILVPSPKVATYDLQPEMSAPEVTEKLIAQLNTKEPDFICLNFANGDMVGHTGVYEAIQKAVKTVDECVGKVVDSAIVNGYDVLIIADHGNADHAVNEDGTPNTAHSLNPVPCIWVTQTSGKELNDGVLADVAPTILAIMGVSQPGEMTGKSLIK